MENDPNPNRAFLFNKRFFDIFFSLVSLILLIPLFLFLSCWIFIVSPGPVIFAQKRYGRKGKFFTCLKFRTMKKNAPHDLPTWEIDRPWQYYIVGGGFLRKYGLDELPQLLNVFLGQMSLIGPRPCGINEASLNEERMHNGAARFRPGLTGYAQVMDRSCEDNHKKALLDETYSGNASLSMDWMIFWKTFSILFKKKKSKINQNRREQR
jgi:O-antigen biosynthesis protein WbqP